MGKNLLSKLAAGLIVVLVGVAPASRVAAAPIVIDTTTGGAATVYTTGFKGTSQTFVALADVLDEWTFFLAPRKEVGKHVLFSIREWNDNDKPGAVIFIDSDVPWNPSGGAHTVSIDKLNKPLRPGGLYAAVVNLLGFDGPSIGFTPTDLYSDGNAFWSFDPPGGTWYKNSTNSGSDQRFIAAFETSSQVPEPGSLALIGLALLGLARFHLVRRGRLY